MRHFLGASPLVPRLQSTLQRPGKPYSNYRTAVTIPFMAMGHACRPGPCADQVSCRMRSHPPCTDKYGFIKLKGTFKGGY
eukprot:2019160-Prymnesium_polylepis.1